MTRKLRICLPNKNYHVFSRCKNGENLMAKEYYKKLLLQIIRETQVKCKFKLIFFSILDNHFHLIIRTEEGGATISKIMQMIKSKFARLYNKMNSCMGPFWNERFGDSIVKASSNPGKYMIHLLWYIAYNACRKGYVYDPRDYEFCPLQCYTENEEYRDIEITITEYFKALGRNFRERKEVFEDYEDIYRASLGY